MAESTTTRIEEENETDEKYSNSDMPFWPFDVPSDDDHLVGGNGSDGDDSVSVNGPDDDDSVRHLPVNFLNLNPKAKQLNFLV